MKMWLIGLCLVIGVCGAGAYENTYTLEDCIVAEACDNGALIQDKNGNLWEVRDVDLHECQVVDLVMDNNGTKMIEDDIVKRVRKVGL